MFFCLAIWNFAVMFLYIPNFPAKYVMFFVNLSSVGWLSVISFIIWFLLLYTKQSKILSYKLFYIILFLIPILFIIVQITNNSLISRCNRQPYGWNVVINDSLSILLLYIYTFLTLVILFIHTFIYSSKIKLIK